MCTTISKCTEFKLPPLHGNKLLLQTKQAYQTCIHSLHTIAKKAWKSLSRLFFLKKLHTSQPRSKTNPFKRVCSTVSVNNFETIFKEILIRFESSLYKVFYYNPNFSSEK